MGIEGIFKTILVVISHKAQSRRSIVNKSGRNVDF